MGTQFRTDYFDMATSQDSLRLLVNRAARHLRDVDFDTLVGTGFSGGVVIPALAMKLRKDFVLIRKEDDDSHHGGGRLIGNLGARWIFVDDFVSSGATQRRVIEKIGAAVVEWGTSTTYVGDYLYNTWQVPEGAKPHRTGRGGAFFPFTPEETS